MPKSFHERSTSKLGIACVEHGNIITVAALGSGRPDHESAVLQRLPIIF